MTIMAVQFLEFRWLDDTLFLGIMRCLMGRKLGNLDERAVRIPVSHQESAGIELSQKRLDFERVIGKQLALDTLRPILKPALAICQGPKTCKAQTRSE
jgi:hypothetical protein